MATTYINPNDNTGIVASLVLRFNCTFQSKTAGRTAKSTSVRTETPKTCKSRYNIKVNRFGLTGVEKGREFEICRKWVSHSTFSSNNTPQAWRQLQHHLCGLSPYKGLTSRSNAGPFSCSSPCVSQWSTLKHHDQEIRNEAQNGKYNGSPDKPQEVLRLRQTQQQKPDADLHQRQCD